MTFERELQSSLDRRIKVVTPPGWVTLGGVAAAVIGVIAWRSLPPLAALNFLLKTVSA